MRLPKKDSAFIPSPNEFIAYLAVGLLLLFVLNVRRFIDYYSNSAGIISVESTAFQLPLLHTFNPKIIASVTTLAFWAMVGLVVYLGLWFFASIIKDARSETVTLNSFLFPKKADRKLYELGIIKRFSIRLIGIIGVILWALLFTKVAPMCSVYFYHALTSDQSLETILKAIVSTVSFGVYLFLLAPTLRMVALKPRIFEDW